MRTVPQRPLPSDPPPGLAYHPAFVSAEDAARLLCAIDSLPWRQDLKRRVQHYGYRYDYRARRAHASDSLGPLPDFVRSIALRLAQEGPFNAVPDQVIVNEYMPGQGISAHIDCRPCFGDVIASLSLLSTCNMRLENRATGQRCDVVLEPRSLLVLSGEARHDWHHAIPARKTDMIDGQPKPRSRRVSLTFRQMRFQDDAAGP